MYYTVNLFSIINYCLHNGLYHYAFYSGINLARTTKGTNNITLKGSLFISVCITEVVYKYIPEEKEKVNECRNYRIAKNTNLENQV